ncbi:MAG: hypothetical protein JXQ73_09300 [Phycisphaerae bacterium]|nr:hypothetical protein [Phycisphaerae bacterium]
MNDDSLSQGPASSHETAGDDLQCPYCDYNLTGLPEDRCPECGEPFDRAALIELLRHPDRPLPFGLEGQTDPSYAGIFVAGLFRPGRLGRELPAAPHVGSAVFYGLAIRLISVFLFALLLAIPSSGEYFFLFLLFALFVSATGYACESVLAWLLASSIAPQGVPRSRRYRFWRTLCHCLSTHVACALVLAGAAGIGLAWARSGRSPTFLYAFYGIPAVMLIWWWLCLARAITQRSLPSAWRTVALMIALCLNPLFFFVIWVMWEIGMRR